ncbi:hypothetical protein ACJIZ3_003623 [Penstemon smallii]|uniref:Uncharacterized protein n=1 Tax=Penstemon smallii TaxID=265156 RepID=A0ABD3UCU6_9LAMI
MYRLQIVFFFFVMIYDFKCAPTMSTYLNRQKELSSAMATTNKTFDLKRKAMLESALAATDTMVDSTNKSSFLLDEDEDEGIEVY